MKENTELNSKLIEFLCEAYELPSSVRAGIIVMTTTVEERNHLLFLAICMRFFIIAGIASGEELEDKRNFENLIGEHLDKILVTAVKLTYGDVLVPAKLVSREF